LNGRPLYRKGYKNALNKKLNPENIIGSSSLQSTLVTFLSSYLFYQLDENYLVASNEAGLHLEINENLSNDIAIYWADEVKELNDKYFNIPPRIVVEVDVKIELEEFITKEEYVFEKTARLLDFGVEKVIWILSKTHKIVIAEKANRNWIVTDWLQEIEVNTDCKFVLNDLLKSKKITQKYAI
jgi:Uma2 family endonuclease